jgi:hypothetical protein
LTVKQVYPACVGVGHFTARAHAGLNRIHLAARVGTKRLSPGTYQISIRTSGGRVVRRVTLVVLSAGATPTTATLQTLRAENTCTTTTTTVPGTVVDSTSGARVSGEGAPTLQADSAPQASGVPVPTGENLHSGVLATSVEKTARAIEPLLVALLAASVLLLGLASLPREAVPGPRMHDVLARHRLAVAALGTAALVAVALAFLVT